MSVDTPVLLTPRAKEALAVLDACPAWSELPRGDRDGRRAIMAALDSLAAYDLDTLRAAVVEYVESARRENRYDVATMSRVYVLDRHNGRIRWSYTTGAPIESSPLVLNGVDYFGAWAGTVYALDLKTHRPRWTYNAGTKITSSASYAGGTVFIGDYGGRLLALSAANGGLRWSGSVNGRVYGTPATTAGRVFVPSSTGGSLTAFSTRGSRLWSLGTGSYVYSSPAVWNGRVYIGSYNGTLYCVSAASNSTTPAATSRIRFIADGSSAPSRRDARSRAVAGGARCPRPARMRRRASG